MAQEVVPPRVREQPAPDWPNRRPEDHDVVVELLLTIGSDGAVRKAEVVRSPGLEYSDAAVEAAMRWVFEPARRGDTPVAARVRALVRFVAQARVSPGAPAPAVEAPPPSGPSVAAAAVPARASPPTNQASPEKTGEIVVTGRSIPPAHGASDYRIHVGELSRVPRKNASELLKLAPGVHLSNEGGEGHAERVYLRGFDAREGQDVEFSVDGVPINESGNLHGNGFADLHFLIPELVLSLHVLEGPFDPRQGNYAVAGSADYELGLESRGLTLEYTRGSFGTERVLVLFGPPGESVHTFGGAEIRRTDGYGKNRDARQAAAMGQYEGSLGGRSNFRLSGAAYANEYHSAGLVREDDVEAGRIGFFGTYDTRQGGGGSRFQLALDVESRSDDFVFYQQLFAIARGMRLRENFTGFLLDTQEALQSPHGQRGDLFDLDISERTIGARGFGRTEGTAFGQKQALELGYFARGDDVNASRQRIEAATGAPYKTDTDLHSKLADLGLYADVTARPLAWLTFHGGFRADLFTFDVLDACAVQDVSRPSPDDPEVDRSCFEQQRGGEHREPNQRSSTASTKIMPRVSVAAGPFRHFTFSLSYGTGVRSIDPNYITQDVATPFASIEAAEGGVQYAQTFDALSVAARSVFFGTHVDRDLVFSETEGRSVLGGGTTRAGWTGVLRIANSWLDENANVTLVRSWFDDTGLLVPYVPDVVVRSDTAVTATLPWELAGRAPRAALGFGASYVGRRALPYGQRSDTIFLLDGSVALRAHGYEFGVEVHNLLDARYRLAEFDFVSSFTNDAAPTLVPARHFAAGAPRAVYVSLSANLGGD